MREREKRASEAAVGLRARGKYTGESPAERNKLERDVPVAQSTTFRLKPYHAAMMMTLTPLWMRLTLMPRTSASFVSSSLTIGISLLSLSDKSAVDVVGDLDVDCATGSFALCAPSRRVCGG